MFTHLERQRLGSYLFSVSNFKSKLVTKLFILIVAGDKCDFLPCIATDVGDDPIDKGVGKSRSQGMPSQANQLSASHYRV